MKYISCALFFMFICAFTTVQIVLIHTTEWWVNLLYTVFVVLSAVVLRPLLTSAISWAVFPYGNSLIAQNHQQDINR